MVQLNDNITANWNGITGQEVLNRIATQFNSLVTSINSTITNVSFEADAEKKDRINYTLYYADGTSSEPRYFELTQISSTTVVLDNISVPDYVEPGSNAKINYSFYTINEDGNRVAGKAVTASITIVNGTYRKEITGITSGTSLLNVSKGTSYTIDSSLLKEGKNVISLTLGGTDQGQAMQFSPGDNPVSQVIYSFSLKINSTLDGINYTQLVSPNKEFTIKNTFTDANNKDITSVNYGIDDTNIITTIYNSSGTQKGTPFTGKESESKTLQNLTIDGLSERAFFIQSKIVFNSQTVYSNVVKYQLVVNDSSLTGNETRIAYCLQNYVANGNSINFVTNTIEANQYSTLNFNLYAYIPVNRTIEYVINNEVIPGGNKTGNTSLLQDISRSCQLTKRDQTIFSVQDDSRNIETITINTINLANDVSVPTGAELSLLSANGGGKTWTSGSYTTTFANFDWNSNGWLDDALVVNDNATAIINILPCEKTIGDGNGNTVTGRSISFRFKTSNENTNECLISCYDNAHDGFQIYPQKARIRKGNQYIDTLFTTEGSEKEITFVWYNTNYGSLSIIYVNGTSQAVLSSGTSTSNSSKITITANETTLYLYNVDVYYKAISFSEVQSLYAYHKASGISNYVLSNAIFGSDVTIGNNTQKVSIDALPVGSTYMLIKAHEDGPDRPWEIINNLPALMTVGNKITETKSWRLLAGHTYLITKVADGAEADAYNFYADKIALSGQGTSSMNYPVKNFRIYFNKKATTQEKAGGLEGFSSANTYGENASKTSVFKQGSEVDSIDYTTQSGDAKAVYRLRAGALPADVFCLKCDYAESSGVHNTGFARMANVALETSGSIQSGESAKLPHNSVAEANPNEPIRSTIDGKPVYLFFADHEGNTTYHGKYNFNNEKASTNIFGFEDNGTSENTSYFDNTIVQEEADLIRAKSGQSTEEYNTTHGTFKNHLGTSYVNPTECWEFSTNDASDVEHRNILGKYLSQIGAFTFPYTSENAIPVSGYPYSGNPTYAGLNPFEELTNDGELAWLNTEQAWEYRYPDFDSGTAGDTYYTSGEVKPYLLQTLYKWVHKHNIYCWDQQQKDNHAAIFANELHNYFNVNYLVKYYVLTKMFINADQRIKNCMLAFYCDPAVQATADMGHMRAYYIFYDNDTILGVNNTGNLTNPWNAGEDYGVYQGIDENGIPFHGIWGNIEYCYNKYINNSTNNVYIKALGKLVEDAYRSLRNALPDTTIKQFLNSSLPDSADNVDAEVKYFYPTSIAPNASDFNPGNISQYQGNRKYHREWLLDKRMKWFDAKYGAGTIENYQISFKNEAASGTMSNGEIALYPEFDEWRFYFKSGDDANLVSTSLLNKDEKGTINYINTVNSNVVRIQGLYGANKIDFSKWYGNTIDNSVSTINNVGGIKPLPYLKEFILGSANGITYIQSDQLNSFFKSGNTVLTPNVETLILRNLKGVNGANITAFDLDLSDLTKLVTLDLTDTDASVVLPGGSLLTTLKMYRPISLVLQDKVNLKTPVLDETSQLTELTVNHCSDDIYNWALSLFLTNYANITSMTITIGVDEDKDTLSDDTISKLVQVAQLVQQRSLSNITITGIGYNAHITQEQNSTLFNVFGADLVISSQDTSEFALNLVSSYLYEGSTLNISPTLKVDEWRIEFVSDPDNIKNNIHVDASSSPYLCVLSADQINNNVSHTVTLKVIATRDDVDYESELITARYVPISEVILNANNTIVNGDTVINVSLDANSTKSHLLDTTYSSNISYSVDNGTVSLITSGTSITGLNYVPAANTDGLISFSLFGITGKLQMYYDVTVCTRNELNSDTSLVWLKDLVGAYWQDVSYNSTSIMRSDLYRYIIGTSGGTITSNIGQGTSIAASEAEGYDLTALKYFRSSANFTIPNAFKFTTLSIPEGVTTIDWVMNYAGYYGYQGIIFPSTTKKVRVNLSLDQVPDALQFDLSKANQIKKIYNESSANTASALPENGIFSLCLTCESLSGSSNILFIYPTEGIDQLGNYSSTTGSAVNVPDAMFNIRQNGNLLDFTGVSEPIYKLGAPTNSNGINIGAISTYKLQSEALSWSTTAPFVKGLYYTFYEGSGCPGSLTFTALQRIGDCSFYVTGSTNNETLNIGSSVTSIGYDAFYGFPHEIQGSTANVQTVAAGGFYGLGVASDFTFTNLTNVGRMAFKSASAITIRLNNETSNITVASANDQPFGINKINTLIVLNQQLKDNLIATYGNDVNIQ